MSVEITEVRRTYRRGGRWRSRGEESVALDGVSLRVPEGEVHGLLGPNGAGKTTLCKILSTVLTPTSGRAEVLGHDVVTAASAVRPLVGIVFGGERGLYWRLSARQNLRYWAALYKLPDLLAKQRTEQLLERMGLRDKADDRVETFSRGMKQRLHLARGLVGDPRLLILDEPTTGMDPVAAHDFRALIGELRGEGRTLLITTHDMREAEEVCDRVTLIDKGIVLATEKPRDLAHRSSHHRWVEFEGDVEGIADLPDVREVVRRGGVTRVRVAGADAVRLVVDRLLAGGAHAVHAVPPTLEDVYLDLIGPRGMGV